MPVGEATRQGKGFLVLGLVAVAGAFVSYVMLFFGVHMPAYIGLLGAVPIGGVIARRGRSGVERTRLVVAGVLGACGIIVFGVSVILL